MYLIVGLGNPGEKYSFTRHNVGYMYIDYLSAKYDIKINKIKFKGLVGEGKIGREKVVFLKPTTFMNLSGESVKEAMNFYKLNSKDIIVVYDDISLQLGKLRIREKGSAGGHNGIKNIIYMLMTDEFKRIKIGIDSERPAQMNLADFVLSKFSDIELKQLSYAVENGVCAIEEIISGNISKAMNLYN